MFRDCSSWSGDRRWSTVSYMNIDFQGSTKLSVALNSSSRELFLNNFFCGKCSKSLNPDLRISPKQQTVTRIRSWLGFYRRLLKKCGKPALSLCELLWQTSENSKQTKALSSSFADSDTKKEQTQGRGCFCFHRGQTNSSQRRTTDELLLFSPPTLKQEPLHEPQIVYQRERVSTSFTQVRFTYICQ